MARAGSGRTLPAQSISTVVEEQHGVAPAGHRLDDQSNTSAERKRRNGRFGSSTINALSFRIPSSAFRVRASRAPAVRRSLQNSVGWGQHPDGLPTGAWQTSDAPALQAGPSGSVTRRPPSFALIESQIGSERRMPSGSELRMAGHQFPRGENEIPASLINSTSVGATPTPATFPGK